MSKNYAKFDVCLGTETESVQVLYVVASENAKGERLFKFIFAPGKGGAYSDGSQNDGQVIHTGARDVLYDGNFHKSELTYHELGQLAWKWPSYDGLYRSGSKLGFDRFPAIGEIDHPFCFAQAIIWNKICLTSSPNTSRKSLVLQESQYPILVELLLGDSSHEEFMIRKGARAALLSGSVCLFVASGHVDVPPQFVSTPVGIFQQDTARFETFVAPNYVTLN